MKTTLMAALISAITLIAIASGTAQAGGWKKGFKHFGGHHSKHHVTRHYRYKRCYRYKKLYLRTRNRFWLKKYKICRFH